MAASPTRHRLALAVALAGVVVSAVTLYVDQRLASDAGYTSFCNVSQNVNCDVVLASRYGRFLDIPVPAWSVLAFVIGAVLAVPGAIGVTSLVADVLLVVLVSASVGFTLVMAALALVVLKAICLLCLSMYVVVAAWAVVVLPFARRLPVVGRPLARRSTAYAFSLAGLLAAVSAGAWSAARVPAPFTTVQEICEADPRFCEYYRGRPTSAPEAVIGSEPHAKGPADAPVTIVEFSDFQCPACAHAFLDLHDLVRRRSDVRLVFRHFPLDERCNDDLQHGVHPVACLAACAAECAGQQGKFWEYHDLLFENQATLSRDAFFGFARELGLDIARFRTCLDAPETMALVRDDVRAGNSLGIESTPTIFINGRRIQGALERHYYDYAITIETQPPGTSG
ncbi:MAG TPA: thioredoxin domain-containing protein [Candidatus Limnocylindria bacterium]|nr:thioredoxin domain-containing protein [Candidatus Limnocylindria bacterium]